MDCSRCIFAITSPPMSGGPFGSQQVGCRVNRLEGLKGRNEAHLKEPNSDQNTEQHRFYQLDRFCNMYRTSKWKRTLEPDQNVQQAASLESKCSFGLVVDISDESKEDIKNTVNSILDLDYKKEKITVVLSVLNRSQNLGLPMPPLKTVHTQELINHTHKLMDKDVVAKLVMHAECTQDLKDKDAFTEPMSSRRNYLIKMKAGQRLDINFLKFIDAEVNQLLNMTSYFEDCSNGISALAFGVVNKHYLDFLDYDLMVKEMKRLSIDQKSYREYEKKN